MVRCWSKSCRVHSNVWHVIDNMRKEDADARRNLAQQTVGSDKNFNPGRKEKVDSTVIDVHRHYCDRETDTTVIDVQFVHRHYCDR